MSKPNRGKFYKGSRFVCLKCGEINKIGEGIYRKRIREKFHIKDLPCLRCKCLTKNVEIRYQDFYEEITPKIEELHSKYYEEVIQ